jgi:hypothetical protein
MRLKSSSGFKRLGAFATEKLAFPQRASSRSLSMGVATLVGVYIMKWDHI